ncbi:aminotransferase class V-fold PLP-dependent enzyme [Leucobacter coleopterorum]|uniref:aminotransferase class V-fold PLP-dependent enzyme n=1 Tax=Leucobacter coleopterorum TaxID=2714933 RepID=UPI001FCB3936|nr:aminotransferase class V-fold PLP-dependent enzyme [Leucobacter coleopterorum]
MARAYLDHAATSPMPEAVLQAYTGALRSVGNPASTHAHGQQASELLESARERIARGLGCDAAEVTLTAGGTEAVNLALKGMYWARRRAGSGPVVLVAQGSTMRRWRRPSGCVTARVPKWCGCRLTPTVCCTLDPFESDRTGWTRERCLDFIFVGE